MSFRAVGRRTTIVLGLILWALLGQPLSAKSVDPAQTKESHHNAAASGLPIDDPTASQVANTTPSTMPLDKQAKSEHAAQSQTRPNGLALGSISDIAQAISTFLLLLTLVYTARAANAAAKSADGADKALQHTISSAGAAIRSAEIAEKALAQARIDSTYTLRPWLVFGEPDFGVARDCMIRMQDTGETWTEALIIFGKVRSVGSTPALKFRSILQILSLAPGEEPDWGDAVVWDGLPYRTMPPGEVYRSEPVFISRQMADAMLQGHRYLIRQEARYKSLLDDIEHVSVETISLTLRRSFEAIITEDAESTDQSCVFTFLPGSVMT